MSPVAAAAGAAVRSRRGDRLRALDAAFLYLEGPDTPMHLGTLGLYDGAGWRDERGRLDLSGVRRHVRSRLAVIPRLRQRPVWPRGRSGRPWWADDAAFDLDRHVRAVRVRRPGSERQLLSLVESLHMELLDRDHPLWELWFVDGLPGGVVAVVEKLHHALVDGIGGVDLAMMLLDPVRTAPPSPGEPPAAVDGAASLTGAVHRRPALLDPVAAALSSPADRVATALALVGGVARAAAEGTAATGRAAAAATAHPLRTAATAGRLAIAAGSVARDLVAPRSPINGTVGTRRFYRIVRWSLDDARAAAHGLGGTVNDVALAAVTAGLRDLLRERGDDLGGADLHALVPVSVRAGDEHRDLGNRVAAMIVPLPVGLPDAEPRFATVHRAVRSARADHQPELSLALLELPEHWPEPVLAAATGLVHHQPLVNVVVTNVPGPPVPLYLAGAELLEVFPIVPLARNLDVSLGVLSYGSHLTVGIWADRDRLPDVEVLVEGIGRGFAELSRAGAPSASA